MTNLVKCIAFTFVLIFSSSHCSAHDLPSIKFRAFAMTSKFLSPDGTWSESTDLIEINYLIVLDFDKQRVTIYAAETVVYDFISEGEIRQYVEGGNGYVWKAVSDGSECTIHLYQPDGRDKNHQLIVSQKYIQSTYHLYQN